MVDPLDDQLLVDVVDALLNGLAPRGYRNAPQPQAMASAAGQARASRRSVVSSTKPAVSASSA